MKQSVQSRFVFSRYHVLVALVAAVLLSGCGGGKPKSSASIPEPVIVANLLSPSEVESMIGGKVDEPLSNHQNDARSGRWVSMVNYYAEKERISLGLSLMPHGQRGSATEAYDYFEKQMLETTSGEYVMKAVSGIGDRAGFEESTKQLTVFMGPYQLIVSITSPVLQGQASLDLNKRIAETVVARLPKK